jgi:hypothetical protein
MNYLGMDPKDITDVVPPSWWPFPSHQSSQLHIDLYIDSFDFTISLKLSRQTNLVSLC